MKSYLCLIAVASLALAGAARAAEDKSWIYDQKETWPLGVFEKENLAKPRPKAPYDMTGTWTIKLQPETGGFNFAPVPKLKPEAADLFAQANKANAEGKAFRDDTGQCWPAGLPKWWTRVWPIQIMQYPTVIIMIQGLFNPVRWIYLDGRGHVNPDIREDKYNGDSIGRWEGDTLVVDTVGFEPKRHWVVQGIPVSDQFHLTEKIKMAKDHQSFTVELIMTDPVNWEGEWHNTKLMIPVKGEDATESHCLPDLNEHIGATSAEHQVQ